MAISVLIVRTDGDEHRPASGHPLLANDSDVVFATETHLA